MAEARAEILRRIRSALDDQPDTAPIPRDYVTTRTADDVLHLLTERIKDYQATVHRVPAESVPSRIAELLSARGARRVAVPADVPASWLDPVIDWVSDDPPLPTGTLDDVDGVLTGCAVAIAETGTIVLDGAIAQGRRMLTLLPDYHLCVVRADQVVTGVPAALARLDPVRPLTFISGPSATSDIELDRVEGVHGPRTLEVLIVAPGGS